MTGSTGTDDLRRLLAERAGGLETDRPERLAEVQARIDSATLRGRLRATNERSGVMNPRVAIPAAAALAVVALVAVGLVLFRDDHPDNVRPAGPGTTLEAPTAIATDGRLAPGRHRLPVYASPVEVDLTLDEGWTLSDSVLDSHQGVRMTLGEIEKVYVDACGGPRSEAETPSPDTAAGAAAWLDHQKSTHQQASEETAVGGLGAVRVEQVVPDVVSPEECRGGRLYVFTNPNGGKPFWSNEDVAMWLVDVGPRLVAVIAAYDLADPDLAAAAQDVVDSITFREG
ncbi:hypothetical protein E8D34_10025 [Nocardioides sp. GY 10113]|uniref:hypothetical protein n=1 Tax=Nocardioides sp. GY 10113 TaxID=2569761 RepID=UPI0010A7E514|nr:hypothetical protein [Nocardioides sp. GY 10113]TIC87453.1 hypothetical protein E8D34_10025 [Nocardioides sp. GY 10113]